MHKVGRVAPTMDRDTLKDSLPERIGAKTQCACDHILRVLEEKRKQMDNEIEEFKARKEEEYREYERRLRNESLGGGKNRNAPQVEETGAGHLRDQANEAKGDFSPPERSNSARRAARRTRSARQALNQAFGGFPGSPEPSNGHQREKEFEGVFTPGYLGLINDNDIPRNGHLHPDTVAAPSTKLSSSATSNPPIPLVAPTSLSSSAPTQSPTQAHHRSDSSNSLLSVSSLRSSMKDPNTPKSPKRVLFSIENGVVVSPSTSPTISRKPTAEKGEALSGDSVGVESMLDFGKKSKRKKNRRKERGVEETRGRQMVREELGDLGLIEERGYMSLAEGWAKPIPTFPSAFLDVSKIAALPNPMATTDDFEKVEKGDEDDMFTFDEDMDDGAAIKAQTNDGPMSGDLSDDDDAARETLPGTSPHAGSLPIEIKWPGRRSGGS